MKYETLPGVAPKFSLQEKKEFLERAERENLTQAELAEVIGVSAGAISQWKKQLNADDFEGRGSRVSLKDKLEALKLRTENDLTYAEAGDLVGVSGNTVYKWQRDFGHLIGTPDILPDDQETEQHAEQVESVRRRLTHKEKVSLLQRQLEERLTNKEAADIAGVSVASISNWKRELLPEVTEEEVLVEPVEAEPTPAALEAQPEKVIELRKFSMTRPDGLKIEAELSFDEIRQLMAA